MLLIIRWQAECLGLVLSLEAEMAMIKMLGIISGGSNCDDDHVDGVFRT